MFVFNDYASLDLIQSYRTISMPSMLSVGSTTSTPNPLMHGVSIYNNHTSLTLVVLLAVSPSKIIENMKSYSAYPMEIEYLLSSTLVGILLLRRLPSILSFKHQLLEGDSERMQI